MRTSAPLTLTPTDSEGTVRCESCGSLCRRGDRYCACCGAGFTAYHRWRYRCATCGAEALSLLANYCSVCGDELRSWRPDDDENEGESDENGSATIH